MAAIAKTTTQKAFRFYGNEGEKIESLAKTLEISQIAVIGKALEALELQLAKKSLFM